MIVGAKTLPPFGVDNKYSIAWMVFQRKMHIYPLAELKLFIDVLKSRSLFYYAS
jgi:hypothetical protein